MMWEVALPRILDRFHEGKPITVRHDQLIHQGTRLLRLPLSDEE